MTDAPKMIWRNEVPSNDWMPHRGANVENWGPWIFHGESGGAPAHVVIDVTYEKEPDTVCYLTKRGHGWGRNYSPDWDEITWYRLKRDHPYYLNTRSDLSAALVRAGIEAAAERIKDWDDFWEPQPPCTTIKRLSQNPEAIAAIVARVTEDK